MSPKQYSRLSYLFEGLVDNLLAKLLEILLVPASLVTLALLLLELVLVVNVHTATAVVVCQGAGHLAVKLDVGYLLVAHHDGVLQVHVQNSDELVLAGLVDQVLDVAKQDVFFGGCFLLDRPKTKTKQKNFFDSQFTDFLVGRRQVANAVVVEFDVSNRALGLDDGRT